MILSTDELFLNHLVDLKAEENSLCSIPALSNSKCGVGAPTNCSNLGVAGCVCAIDTDRY